MIIYLASVQREINAQAAKETCLSLPVDRRGSDLLQNNTDLHLNKIYENIWKYMKI